MPRFVLLYHDCPHDFARPSHWDLMLESGDMLRTWALPKLPNAWQAPHVRTLAKYPNCPPLASTNEVTAEELADHRRDYLEYEGDVSNNRGRVIRVAAGEYSTLSESPTCWEFLFNDSGTPHRLRLSGPNNTTSYWKLSYLTCHSERSEESPGTIE